jgi:hypothetical protein
MITVKYVCFTSFFKSKNWNWPQDALGQVFGHGISQTLGGGPKSPERGDLGVLFSGDIAEAPKIGGQKKRNPGLLQDSPY